MTEVFVCRLPEPPVKSPSDRGATRFRGQRLLVSILAASLGVRAEDVRLARRCRVCGSTQHGKPYLDAHGAPHFSVSHPEGFVGVAVNAHHEVGLDLVRADLLAPDVGHALGEPAILGEPARIATNWCRKEALLKATGHGLAIAPSEFRVTHSGRVRGWPLPGPIPTLADLDVPWPLAGAVALLSPVRGPLALHWMPLPDGTV